MKNLKDVGKRGFEPPFCALGSLTSLQGLRWVYPAARPTEPVSPPILCHLGLVLLNACFCRFLLKSALTSFIDLRGGV